MILINLLPHREERRKRRKQAFFAGMGLAAVAGLLIAGGWWFVLDTLKTQQEGRNAFLTVVFGRVEHRQRFKVVGRARVRLSAVRQHHLPNESD